MNGFNSLSNTTTVMSVSDSIFNIHSETSKILLCVYKIRGEVGILQLSCHVTKLQNLTYSDKTELTRHIIHIWCIFCFILIFKWDLGML